MYTVDRLIVWWLVFVYFVFGLCWLLRDRRGFRPLAPALASVFTLAVVLVTAWNAERSESSVTVLDVGQGQCVAAVCGENAVLIDCGGKGTWDNAGDTAAEYLLSRGRRSIDALVLTHLHADHANGVERLLTRISVGTLYLPEDTDDSDGLLGGILACAERQRTEVVYVGGEDLTPAYGGLELTLYAPLDAGDENERGVIVLAAMGEFEALIMGDVNSAVERRLVESRELPDVELLVVGHHGSKYSTSFELLEAIDADWAAISVGWNSYGHPTYEALRRLGIFDIEVFRTDENGNITVRANTYG